MRRLITNTAEFAQHDWPDDVFIQGGDAGVAFATEGNYRTAFFEAFPENTFLRGEGKTIAEAEESCWSKYQRYAVCDGTGNGHGPYERRQYRNGAGFCTRCGIWMNRVFDPLPEDDTAPRRGRTLAERVFVDKDPDAMVEVLQTAADVDLLPEGPASALAAADADPT